MDEDFERLLMNMIRQMVNAFSAGAMGVRISVSSDGDVRVDPIRPRKRRLYVPFEVVDAGDAYVITLDLRHLPPHATRIRLRGDGVLVETPKGERLVYVEEPVDPESAEVNSRDGIVEITVKKGEGTGEKVIDPRWLGQSSAP